MADQSKKLSLKEAVDSMTSKFASGNEYLVERSSITRAEWEVIWLKLLSSTPKEHSLFIVDFLPENPNTVAYVVNSFYVLKNDIDILYDKTSNKHFVYLKNPKRVDRHGLMFHEKEYAISCNDNIVALGNSIIYELKEIPVWFNRSRDEAFELSKSIANNGM